MATESEQKQFVGEREKLLVRLHPKRAGYLFYYIFSAVVFIVGTAFMVSVAARIVPYDELAWWFGFSGMAFGFSMFIGTEFVRQNTLYVITTWNVRKRTGFFNKETMRIFYDDITLVESSLVPAVRPLSMGNVYIYTKEDGDQPSLVLKDIFNPMGIRELIVRIIDTTPLNIPWAHIEKTRTVRFS